MWSLTNCIWCSGKKCFHCEGEGRFFVRYQSKGGYEIRTIKRGFPIIPKSVPWIRRYLTHKGKTYTRIVRGRTDMWKD